MSGETVTSVTTNAPADEHWNTVLSGTFAAGATEAGAASVTMDFALGGSDHWAAGGVPIKPASNCAVVCLAADGTASSSKTTGTTITIPHTTSGTNRLMLVGVSINNDALEEVQSVKYNGIDLSFVGFIRNSDDARVEIWQLTETNGLPTGTHNVVIDFKIGATPDVDLLQSAVAGVMTFEGVSASISSRWRHDLRGRRSDDTARPIREC
jgi:hypothetical protein